MPRRDPEEEDDAPPPPSYTTLTKASRKDGACHAGWDAKGTESESDADGQNQFDESTDKKRPKLNMIFILI